MGRFSKGRFASHLPELGISVCLGLGILGASLAQARQDNMLDALNALRNARASLVLATPNKGGHRERAIELVDQAIMQTQAGINYANR
ncbi:MAG: hypothetical protein RLZZ158_1406 [Cyanobacteriota bacterium]|jgi:hypothetical protein